MKSTAFWKRDIFLRPSLAGVEVYESRVNERGFIDNPISWGREPSQGKELRGHSGI